MEIIGEVTSIDDGVCICRGCGAVVKFSNKLDVIVEHGESPTRYYDSGERVRDTRSFACPRCKHSIRVF